MDSQLVNSLVYFFFSVVKRVGCGSARAALLRKLLRNEHSGGFEGDHRSAFGLSSLQAAHEVLAQLVDQLARVLRALHALVLHEADESGPVGETE